MDFVVVSMAVAIVVIAEVTEDLNKVEVIAVVVVVVGTVVERIEEE